MNNDELITKYLTNGASSNICKYLNFIAVFGHDGHSPIMHMLGLRELNDADQVAWFNALPIPGNELEVSLYRNCLSVETTMMPADVIIEFPEVVKALKTYFDISLGSDSSGDLEITDGPIISPEPTN